MGVQTLPSTIIGGVTPTCNCCGIALCWDIADDEYDEDRAFWNSWICETCNGGKPMSLKQWRNAQRHSAGAASTPSGTLSVTRDDASGHFTPKNADEWRAVLDAAGLRDVPTPSETEKK